MCLPDNIYNNLEVSTHSTTYAPRLVRGVHSISIISPDPADKPREVVRGRFQENKASRGFSLLEILITMAIIGIISGFTYPLYQNAIAKSKRYRVQTLLLQLAGEMEDIRMQSNSYLPVVSPSCQNNLIKKLLGSEQPFYLIEIRPVQKNYYALKAIALPQQARYDDSCREMMLDAHGKKSPAYCWM